MILGEVLVIALAKWKPQFGVTGGVLRPEITISKIGVFIIFFINGIALSFSGGRSSSQIKTATKTNALIQFFNFGFIPLTVKFLAPFFPHQSFRDGLLVLSCLPCTINICVAQTLAAGGDMGTAIFNAIFANVLGVVLTPLLATWMLGVGQGVSLLDTLTKLGAIVILPLIAGQLCRKTPLLEYFEAVSKKTRTLSSLLLLAIVYNVFCDTFSRGLGVGGKALADLSFMLPISYLTYSFIFWQLSKYMLPQLSAQTRAAAVLCSSQKTLAFGIPFIKTALGDRADIAYILAPLLLYAPTQLFLGSSLFVPYLRHVINKAADIGSGGAET